MNNLHQVVETIQRGRTGHPNRALEPLPRELETTRSNLFSAIVVILLLIVAWSVFISDFLSDYGVGRSPAARRETAKSAAPAIIAPLPPIPVSPPCESGPTGSVSGVVSWDGPLPVPTVLFRTPQNGPIPDEHLVVNLTNRGIANVVVYLSEPPKGACIPAIPTTPASMSILGAAFSPRILVTRAFQPVVVTNRDPVTTNIHTMPLRNGTVNVTLKPLEQVTFASTYPERLPVTIHSNLQNWMKAYLIVLDHPYVAVTDADGRFTIDGLPPGTHEFVVWHESAGYLHKRFLVKIAEEQTTSVEMPIESARFSK